MFPPSNHGLVSPSRLQRIVDCPGSFRLTRDIESQQSVYAEEGSMLHAEVEMAINSGKIEYFNPDLNDEQHVAVQDCLDYYYNLLKTVDKAVSYTEKRVFLKGYHQCLHDCFGTCDIIITNANELHVIDWKFGKGVPVYASNNDQLYAYAAGAMAELDLRTEGQVFIHCIQPRLNSFDVVELKCQDIYDWLDSRIIPGVSRAYEKHAPFNPGKSQCRWCPAKNNCRARFNASSQTAADVFKAATQLPDEVTIEEISELVRRCVDFEAALSDLRLYLQRELESGRPVPGWKMVHGRSIRKWASTTAAEEWMIDNSDGNYERLYETKLISPARAERRFRTWKKNEEFNALIVKPEGKPKLALDTDPRQAIEYQTAADKFKEAE